MTDAAAPLIFHIGYPKTATTFLQHQIFSNPALGLALGGGNLSRAHLFDKLVLDDGYQFDAAATAQKLRDLEAPQRAAGLTPIWSDETLIGDCIRQVYNGHAIAQRITGMGVPVKIIITVREQRSFCMSAWREYVKSGGQAPFTRFLGTGDEPLSYSPLLRPDHLMYHRPVGYYVSRLGAENVLVAPQEQMKADPAAFFGRLGAFLGRDLTAAPVAKPENKSEGALAIAVRQRINRLAPPQANHVKRSLIARAVPRLISAIDRITPTGANDRLKTRMTDQIDQRYKGLFAESNGILEASYGVPLSALGYET